MRQLLFTLSFLILSLDAFEQNVDSFIITEVLNDDTSKTGHRFVNENLPFFEDSIYRVRKTCSGEWGGTVWFKNKLSGIEYSCTATCPVAVLKRNDKYFVTSSLAHISGFTEILEIANPDSLSIFKIPEPRNKSGNLTFRYSGDLESNSRGGTKTLLDTTGIVTLAAAVFNDTFYYIITDFDKTYLATVEDHKFKKLQTVFNQSIWTSDPEPFQTKDNHLIVHFSNETTKGYLDIYKNRINVMRTNSNATNK